MKFIVHDIHDMIATEQASDWKEATLISRSMSIIIDFLCKDYHLGRRGNHAYMIVARRIYHEQKNACRHNQLTFEVHANSNVARCAYNTRRESIGRSLPINSGNFHLRFIVLLEAGRIYVTVGLNGK